MKSEAGAGTVLALAVIFVVISSLIGGAVIAQQSYLQRSLEATTETMALAAADALLGVSTGFPCIVAKDIAAMSQVNLERCRIVGFEVFIETASESFGFTRRAKARAGPG
ncbi:MAG: hypothetical protein ACKOXT_01430 [Actinomycetota bacterium]